MEKKHAYLILAHHEFDILQKLVQLLDDPRNDIYIHLDKKVLQVPTLQVEKSTLYMLNERVDIRWGNVSQIQGTYCLLEQVTKSNKLYDYCHLISGVHLPLYSQNYIHDFFDKAAGKQFFLPMQTSAFQTDLKMNRYNLLTKTFADPHPLVARVSQIVWHLAHRLQRALHIRRFSKDTYAYASNWVSITPEAIRYLVDNKARIIQKYRYTFCGDEYFVPTELLQSTLTWEIHYEKRLLLHEIKTAHAKTYTEEDFSLLLNSECLFARKFSSAHMPIVDQIVKHLSPQT